jgi:2-succinyl-6-hydroxy-2,4-cyclohexadiene-1-carboxylate synthase
MTDPVFTDYAIARYDTGSGDPVALLHGFTQTAASWNPVVRELARSFTCISVDMPGHGDSPIADRSVSQCAHDIAHSVGRATYIGYSMGARVALHIALQFPELVERLVLISGTPGIQNEADRNERRHDDELLAEYIQETGMNRFINEWIKQPMFAGLPPEFARLDERKQNDPQDIADSLRSAGTGTQEPVWEELSNLQMPVLLVVGQQDQKFVQIAEQMHDLIPNSTLAVFNDVGHTVHLENVYEFCTRLQEWMNS